MLIGTWLPKKRESLRSRCRERLPATARSSQRLCALGFFAILLALTLYSPVLGAPRGITFDAERAFQFLKEQVALGPRNPGSTGHQAGREYLSQKLTLFCDRVYEQDFVHTSNGGSLTMTNVIGVVNPYGERVLLLGAHWDTRPFAERDPNPAKRGEPILGANDGASGVAVLLELAAQLAESKRLSWGDTPYEIIFAFFDGEDFGSTTDEMFLGSRFFAGNMGELRPDRAIILDMVGDAQLNLRQETNSLLSDPELLHLIWEKGAELGFNQFSSEIESPILDDHIPLIEEGVPAIDIIDIDYKHWHTAQDTTDKCSPESLRAVGETLLQLILEGRF